MLCRVALVLGCPGGALCCDPVHGEEGFKFVFRRIVHEFFKDPFKIGMGIEAVAADLFDEGVDDGTSPAGFFAAYKHPIIHTDLGRTNGVFGEVVVELDLPVEETGFEVLPLVAGVAERFPKVALGKDLAFFVKVGEEFFKMVVGSTGFDPTGFLSLKWSGSLSSEFGFDPVNPADEQEDPGDDSRVVFGGFTEFSPDVGEAADGDDVEMFVSIYKGAVGSQAVALEVATEGGFAIFADEDVVEASVGSAFVPIKKRAVLGVVIDPELSFLDLAISGDLAVDGCLVDFDVVAAAKFPGDELVEREEASGKVVVPVAHVVAGEINAVGGFEFPLLAVKGAVVAKLLGKEIGSERGGEDASGKEAGFKRRGEGDGVGIVFANVGLTFDDFPGEGGGGGVKSNADFFPEEAEEFGMVPDFLIHDDFFDGGKPFERTEKSVGAGGFLLFGLRGIVWVSRRLVVFATGGFLLFCFVLQEGEQQLIVIDLFAFGSVDAGEEGRDDGLLGFQSGFEFGVFLSKCSHFSGQFFDLLCKGFDGVLRSNICAGLSVKSHVYRTSYQGRCRPSRRSMPSVSMARAVGLRMSF